MHVGYQFVDRDVVIVAADGRIDSQDAQGLVDSVSRLVDAGARKIIVDCTQVHFISSYGIGVLVILQKKLAERNGDVKLASVKSPVIRVLEMTRLDRIFKIYPSVEEARHAFRTHQGPDGV